MTNRQYRALHDDVDDVVTALTAAAKDIDSHRTVLLGKVADATEGAPHGPGLTVDDTWTVQPKVGVAQSVIDDHQDEVNRALTAFNTAVDDACTAIGGPTEIVRAGGDLLGSALDVSDAPTQGARLGGEDGNAVAAAAADGDMAKLDEMAGHLPQYPLTRADLDALAAGKSVGDLPPDVLDYYRAFLHSAGSKGVLALSNRLDSAAKSGNTVAASRETALADGVNIVSNERIATSTGSHGDYNQLPPDIQNLVSGRWSDKANLNDLNSRHARIQNEESLAGLMSHASPGIPPGRTLGIELGRQGADLANYADTAQFDSEAMREMGFSPSDRDQINAAAQRYLTAGTSNHESAYALLTGQDVPQDPAGAALGGDYHPSNYNSQRFLSTVFNHDWPDHGKAAAGLYAWAGGHTNDAAPTGDLARQTLTALPTVLAPVDQHGSLVVGSGNKTVFEHNADAFIKNPELATGLSKVMGSSINYFGDKDADLAPGQIGLDDTKNLLFLSSQSPDGRNILDTARQNYDNAVLVAHGNLNDPLATTNNLADVNAHIDEQERNATTFQQYDDAAKKYAEQMHGYTDREDIAKIGDNLVNAIPIPGVSDLGKAGQIVANTVGSTLKPDVTRGLDSWNPKPTPGAVQYPHLEDFGNTSTDAFNRNIALPGMAPQDTLDMTADYQNRYNRDIGDGGLVTDNNQLRELLHGGAQAVEPDSGQPK